MEKNPPANAGDMRHGSIPGPGRAPKKEMVTHYSSLAWRIPWTEEPCGLQFHEVTKKKSDTTEVT